jgi:hypothetical protein
VNRVIRLFTYFHSRRSPRGALTTVFFVMTKQLQKLSAAVSNKALSGAQSARTRGDNLQRAPPSPRVACCKRRSQLSHCGSSAKNFDLLAFECLPRLIIVSTHTSTLLLITTRARVSSGRADTRSSAHHLLEILDFARRFQNHLLRHSVAGKGSGSGWKILALERNAVDDA